MNSADLNRFLVVCALVSDLYCPSYNSTESLSKDSNLGRTALRYRIATAESSRHSAYRTLENVQQAQAEANQIRNEGQLTEPRRR